MKKLFLLLTAFTCIPTYSSDNNKSSMNSGVVTFLVIGGAVISGYCAVRAGKYVYNKYWNVPNNNTPQPTNTVTPENDNEAPKNNDPVVTPRVNYPFTPPIQNPIPFTEKIKTPNKEFAQILTQLEEIKKQDEQAQLKDKPAKPVLVATPVVEKIKTEKKEETPWHHNKNLIKMMYDI